MNTRYPRHLGALAIALLSTACTGGDRSATAELVTGVQPSAMTTAPTGGTLTLRVGQSLRLQPVNLKRSIRWSSSNPAVASVGRNGDVVGVTGGQTVITAATTTSLERTTVNVSSGTPTVTSLTLSPGTVQLAPGRTQQFSVTARWSDGSTTLPPLTYSATGGTISSSGLYTAGSLAGTFMVIATCGCGVADTTPVAIQLAAPAPTLSALRISPKTTSVGTSASVQFATTASWSNGETTLPAITYTALDGGSVNGSTGLFVAPATAGTYRVMVGSTAGPVRDTATVTVTAPVAQLVTLRISPKTVSVAGGAAVQFSAAATWSTGATQLPPVSYSTLDGGVVNASSGAFTAPTTSGTYRVVVAHTGGSLRDTATVTVSGTTPTPAPAPTAFTPNLPAGMTLVGDDNYETAPTLEIINWSGITTQSATTFGVAIVNTDAGRALRAWFPERHAGDGVGPLTLMTPEIRTRSLYMAVRMRYSSNYEWHTNGEKLFYPISANPQSGAGALNVGRSGELMGVAAPFEAFAPGEPIAPAGTVPRPGQWFTAEFYVRYNSPGRSDGVWQVWINGRQVINRTSQQFFRDAVTQPVFLRGRLDFTRGGGPSTVLTPLGGQFVDVDRVAFYTGN